ncbi:hypothetical protein M413DRAFT_427845 [Hebeloma cylindrosporum]|uniref:Uncharacterized protein n=1 Tax=Hebeloma cylindrosporum TaxID=76867 RepID=A0A0C2Y569_HEBCY|nr:hypothetical protein M413DRAFT_427845 [Hebeloma cylindrosporum h7]
MGRRHQAFIIARGVPHGSPPGSAQYRCVGAVHGHWCYGLDPPRAATRFMTLIKQEDNAATIREELLAIDGLYGRPNPPIPDLLLARVGLKMMTESRLSMSLIPRTLPTAFFSGARPLSATEYVNSYYWIDEVPTEPFLSTLRPYESVPLLTIQTLAEAWPDEYGALVPATEATEVAGNNQQPREFPLLADLVLKPAVEQALLSGSHELELIMAISDKRCKIKEILRSRQDPIPASGIPLLSKLVELEIYDQPTKTVDLSQYLLSDHQILDIVAQHPDLGVLNLSHNKQITIAVVENLLVALPKLRRLLLLNTSISEEDVISLLERRPELFRHLEGFIHPALLKGPSEAQFKGAYIIQGLTDYLSALESGRFGGTRATVMTAYASQARRPDQSWAERVVGYVPANSGQLQQALKRKGKQWLFVFLTSWSFRTLNIDRPAFHGDLYGLFELTERCGMNKYSKVKEQIDGEVENSTPPTTSSAIKDKRERTAGLRKEFGPRLFEIFNVEQFFKELELEGWEPPSPGALSQLFDIFPKLDKRAHLDDKLLGGLGLQLIELDELVVISTMGPRS